MGRRKGEKEGVESRGKGKDRENNRGSVTQVLYSMNATLYYSIAQHMFSYAVPESFLSILLL